jgi:hypothetical protein
MVYPSMRYRHNVDELLESWETFIITAYDGSGAPFLTNGCDGPRLPWKNFSFIADHSTKPHDPSNAAGFYPAGRCFQVTTDFSKVNLDRETHGGGNTIRFDTNGAPFTPFNNDSLSRMLVGSGHNPAYYGYSWPGRVPDEISNDLQEQAWNYFSDVFPTKLSFSEFVQGFTQLKDLMPAIGDSIGKTISGGYLNKSFGWDNLLKDLETLGNLTGLVLSRMEYLHRTYNIPTRLGFARGDVYTPSEPIIENYNWYCYPAGWIHHRLRLTNFKVDFRATTWIRQHLDFIHDIAGFIRVLIGALGLNNPVKAFWNTVPLSFVVDWFFNTSQHLDNLTRINPAMGWDVVNTTHSFTYEYTFEIDQLDYMSETVLNKPTEIVKTKIYDRYVGLSFGWELLNPNELSPTQLTLFLAMLHQLS